MLVARPVNGLHVDKRRDDDRSWWAGAQCRFRDHSWLDLPPSAISGGSISAGCSHQLKTS
jgi:hypothetical protein